jgi:gliding motility-associated-like protein
MKTIYSPLLSWALLMVMFILTTSEAYASHAQGSDLTYQCLGGNQYRFTLKFYRDCSGVNAPNTVTVNARSTTCNQNFNITLNQIANTGQEVTPVCPNVTTTCTNGNINGVREYIYQGISNNIIPCTDWVFSFSLCCRNNAITNIQNPGGQNIYIQATLDNLNFPCNNSPTFTNRPVPYFSINQPNCFNHGASDPDGDFLVYSLVTPMTGPTTTVTYNPPYSATQPLASNPPVSFNAQTGDICMTPTMQQVTVMAVKVEEYRNNQLVGSVMRDIQIQTLVSNNNNPSLNGINGTGQFSANVCANTPFTFFTNSFDPDQNQNLTITWNNAIPNATLNVGPGNNPTATFSWTPTSAQISPNPYCFTITVTDNNCPLTGSQTYAFCLYVGGFTVSATGTNANCGAHNGTATATVTGGIGPFTYQWSPSGGNNAQANGLAAGTYTVVVTDATGCTGSATVTILNNGMPGNVQTSFTQPSCTGGSNGTATANPNGQPPFTYLWSTGATTATATGLSAGTYTVTITNGAGCTTSTTITVTNPPVFTATSSQTDVSCFGGNNGSATSTPSTGSGPYTYAWSNGQTTQTASGLSAGNYFVTVTNASGCTATLNVLINQPPQLQINLVASNNATCFGDTSGSATVQVTGGSPPYQYLWNTNPPQIYQTAANLGAGTYQVTVTDAKNCTITLSATITQPPQITAAFSSTQPSCFGGNNGNATVNASGGTPPFTYSWNTTPQQTTQTATGLSAGSYQVIITDIYGCSSMANVTLSQPSPVVSQISGVGNVSCAGGNNGWATGNGAGGNGPYTYSWNTSPVQTGNSATGLSAGVYTLTVTDANGCAAVTTVTINGPQPLSMVATANDTICPGQSVTISANASGGNGGYQYTWSQGLGNGQSHMVSPTSTTTYQVVVTDAQGCTGAAASVTIYVYQLSPLNLHVSNTGNICAGAVSSVSSTTHGFTGPVTYSWSHNLGTGPGPINVNPSSTTTYTITVTNQCGQSATATTTVTVYQVPQISLSPKAGTGCDRVSVFFSDAASNATGCTFSWNFGDGYTSTQPNPVHNFTQTGTYNVTVTIVSPFGCSTTSNTTVQVVVNVSPTAAFTADPFKASQLAPTIRFFDQSLNADTWFWDFGDGNTSGLRNPSHTYAQKGEYTVTLITSNQAGCWDTVTHKVEIEPEFTFYIPNAFTPNGDNHNDIFMGKGNEISEFQMEIFDRWGMMIFKSTSLEQGWDGRVQGGADIAQQDVYVYKIVLRDFSMRQHFYTGHVSLIK